MDLIRYIRARERRRRTIGAGARCAICGESQPFALLRVGKKHLCYEHRLRRATEVHHAAGLRRGPTLVTPSNDHLVLTARQLAWPAHLLNQGRSPAEEALATMLGLVQFDDCPGRSPFLHIDVPTQGGDVIIPLAVVPGFLHTYHTDRSWYRKNALSPWLPCPWRPEDSGGI